MNFIGKSYLVNLQTRNRGSTRSAYARRRGGERFESRLDTASHLKTLNMVPTAAMSGTRHGYGRGECLGPKQTQTKVIKELVV